MRGTRSGTSADCSTIGEGLIKSDCSRIGGKFWNQRSVNQPGTLLYAIIRYYMALVFRIGSSVLAVIIVSTI